MTSKNKTIVLVLLLVVILVGAGIVYGQLKQQSDQTQIPVATEKIAIPNFELQDWEGNIVEFSEFNGKPVIINFWASWCPYCVEEMPYFETMYKEFGEDIHFLMIDSVDGTKETIQKGKDFLAQYDYTFPVYFDTQFVASQIFGLQGLPATFLIDSDGFFVAWINGMTDEATLRKGVEILLEK